MNWVKFKDNFGEAVIINLDRVAYIDRRKNRNDEDVTIFVFDGDCTVPLRVPFERVEMMLSGQEPYQGGEEHDGNTD